MMTHYRKIADADLAFLEELAELIDRRLVALDRLVGISADPDSEGLFDPAEYAVRIGFLACDTYMTELIGKSTKAHRRECRMRGPRHRNYPIAEIVHAAAAFVKHYAEGMTHVPTVQLLRDCGVLRDELGRDNEAQDYAMANLLYRLCEPEMRFAPLVRSLEEWRDAVIEAGLA